MKRVLIITDRRGVGHGIRTALQQAAELKLVGASDAKRPARLLIAQVQPDIVLVEGSVNRTSVLDRLHEAAEEAPLSTRVLLSARMDEDWNAAAFDAGATAIVSLLVHPIALGTILREMVRGNVRLRSAPLAPVRVSGECPLTSREQEILALVALGMTNAQIARRIWVTEQTVKFHLSNTYRKLGVANRTEAGIYAHLNDLVPAQEPRVAC
jgi:DNA-binding NarL/FixJ family response regulator